MKPTIITETSADNYRSDESARKENRIKYEGVRDCFLNCAMLTLPRQADEAGQARVKGQGSEVVSR